MKDHHLISTIHMGQSLIKFTPTIRLNLTTTESTLLAQALQTA